MTPDPRLTAWLERPYSWSCHSSFLYSPEAWFNKYILGIETPNTPELIFGKKFADSCEARTPLAPVTLLSKVEHPFEATFDGISLLGYADTIDDITFLHLGEFKTGGKPWDQKRVDTHGQIDFYLFMNWLTNNIDPTYVKVFLEWVPTRKIPNPSGFGYTIDFAETPHKVVPFETSRTKIQVLSFAASIKSVRAEMVTYAENRLSELSTPLVDLASV